MRPPGAGLGVGVGRDVEGLDAGVAPGRIVPTTMAVALATAPPVDMGVEPGGETAGAEGGGETAGVGAGGDAVGAALVTGMPEMAPPQAASMSARATGSARTSF